LLFVVLRRASADRINPSSITARQALRRRAFPDDATDIVYDARHGRISAASPQLRSTRVGKFPSATDFWKLDGRRCQQAGYQRRAGPKRQTDETIGTERAFYSRDVRDGGPRQPPILLGWQRRDDGKTSVEIRIAPFMMPQELELARDAIGLPVPNIPRASAARQLRIRSAARSRANVAADLPVVLAF